MISLSDIESFHTLNSKRDLGLRRWDFIKDNFSKAGSMVIPMRLDDMLLEPPFYYIYEKLTDRFLFYVKYLNREPFMYGDVYGFYGLSNFKNFKPGYPIIITEGIADLAALRTIYPFTLACLTGSVSEYQRYILSCMTDKLIISLDKDKTGIKSLNKLVTDRDFNSKFSMKQLVPSYKDFGMYLDSSFGIQSLSRYRTLIKKYLFSWGYDYNNGILDSTNSSITVHKVI